MLGLKYKKIRLRTIQKWEKIKIKNILMKQNK